MSNSEIKNTSDKLGTEAITPLIMKMSLPSMFSMLIQALYNVVDSIFVSRLGESALSAVSLVYPIQLLNVAVGVGTGVGLSSLISRRLGQKNIEEADSAANHGVLLACFSWLIFALFGLFGVGPFVRAFSETPDLVTNGIQYGKIVCLGCIFAFNATNGERIMQACGDMISPMLCSLAGAITNVILDPIMIFGLFGTKALGVAGAAYATVIGQFVSMIVTFTFIRVRHLPVQIKLKGFRPNWLTIKNIYQVAIPSMLMQSINSVTTICMNAILIGFSETAVAVLGVYFKLESFVFMPVFGMNQGVIPILGYNFGAKNKHRLLDTFKKSLIIAFSIMFCGMLIFQFIPGALLSLFKAEGDMLTIGIKALRTISYCFPLAALGIIPGTLFTATAHGYYSMITALCRNILFKVPLAWLLSRSLGIMGIWYAYPLAEIISLCVSITLFRKLYKNEIKDM